MCGWVGGGGTGDRGRGTEVLISRIGVVVGDLIGRFAGRLIDKRIGMRIESANRTANRTADRTRPYGRRPESAHRKTDV